MLKPPLTRTPVPAGILGRGEGAKVECGDSARVMDIRLGRKKGHEWLFFFVVKLQ